MTRQESLGRPLSTREQTEIALAPYVVGRNTKEVLRRGLLTQTTLRIAPSSPTNDMDSVNAFIENLVIPTDPIRRSPAHQVGFIHLATSTRGNFLHLPTLTFSFPAAVRTRHRETVEIETVEITDPGAFPHDYVMKKAQGKIISATQPEEVERLDAELEIIVYPTRELAELYSRFARMTEAEKRALRKKSLEREVALSVLEAGLSPDLEARWKRGENLTEYFFGE
jgi:hypothetical protein